jgi:hypothetical protein
MLVTVQAGKPVNADVDSQLFKSGDNARNPRIEKHEALPRYFIGFFHPNQLLTPVSHSFLHRQFA